MGEQFMQLNSSEEIIYLNSDLVRKIEKVISTNPALNFTVIINQALKEWFKHPQSTNFNRECFITDAQKRFGPTY